ncbi:MAG: hypothetical protein IPJ60_01635 [Sphingobacteriaceae bacterium]|nr:hypothetical protein [Sphingobacteriaceae bacterium]
MPALAYSKNNYYAFGSQMPGRQYNSNSYRYGFNGKENDNEVKGTGNQQDYGMRIYDNRLGRFLSVDPIGKNFAYYTTYQFAANKPITAIDVDGLEDVHVTTKKGNRVMLMTFTRTDINQIMNGGHPIPRITYDNSKESVGQFAGPNKKNEKAVYDVVLKENEEYIKNELVPKNLKNNITTTGYNPIKATPIKEPVPVKSIEGDANTEQPQVVIVTYVVVDINMTVDQVSNFVSDKRERKNIWPRLKKNLRL